MRRRILLKAQTMRTETEMSLTRQNKYKRFVNAAARTESTDGLLRGQNINISWSGVGF